MSTWTEIVGVDDSMPAILWTNSFVASQVYNVKDNHLHRDNKSSVLLQKLGKASSSKITKHVNIWYSFITYIVNNGEVSVVWCPTRDVISEYMTKPLQGAIFRNFRYQIMGVIPDEYMGQGNLKV